MRPTSGPAVGRLLVWLLLLTALLPAAHSLAQTPFGVGRPPAAAAPGLLDFVLTKQAEFYRSLAGAIRAAKTDGTALFGLMGLSLIYGVFHAAGPGHGKAVISAYLLANEETWRRGIALAFLSALLQAVVAVALVGLLAALIGATAKVMGDTVRVIEMVSYGLIVALGARLVLAKAQELVAVLRHSPALSPPLPLPAQAAAAGHAHGPACGPGHGSAGVCEHSHGPQPTALAGPGGWARGLSAVIGVGLRPCSGAILVLVFALAQGLFWAGVASTIVMGLGTAITVAAIAAFTVGAKGFAQRLARAPDGLLAPLLLGLELMAALAVLLLGVLLLGGYLASERLFGM